MVPETHTVELSDGGSLHAVTSGAGQAIVFIGGLGDDHTLFAPLTSALTDTNLCVTFDNRGAGASSPPRPRVLR